jgi:hypothetical protein
MDLAQTPVEGRIAVAVVEADVHSIGAILPKSVHTSAACSVDGRLQVISNIHSQMIARKISSAQSFEARTRSQQARMRANSSRESGTWP